MDSPFRKPAARPVFLLLFALALPAVPPVDLASAAEHGPRATSMAPAPRAGPRSGAAPGDSRPASITGRVLDPQLQPVARASVQVDGPLGTVAASVTDREGRFLFEALPPGQWHVLVLADGLRAEPCPVTVVASDAIDLTVRMQVSAVRESIVVSASHVETPLSRLPTSTTVITDEELRALQVEAASDALSLVPGLHVARSGGRLGLTSVFPRGGESDYTLVAVDGLRLNGFGGAFDFGGLPSADIERLEVVRGPQSAVFGADAIGGIVHVITRQGGPLRAQALGEAGAFATTRVEASAAGTHGVFQWGGALERASSEGFTGLAPGTLERVTNDDGHAESGSFSAGVVRPGFSVRSHVRASSTTRGYPGPFGLDPNGTFGGVDHLSRGTTTTRAGGVTASWTASRVRARGEIGRAQIDGRFASPFGDARSETARTDGRVHFDVALGAGTSASAGVELVSEHGGSTYVTGERGQAVPVARRVAGTYAEVRLEPTSRLFASAGLRVERIRRLPLEGDPSAFAPRPGFDDDTVVSLNPRIAAGWFLRPAGSGGWTRLHASAGTGIRPPDVFEIAFTDNPSLAPERSRSVDAGVEYAAAGGRLVLDLTWFANRYDDLIVAVGQSFADASRFRTDNIANARARGAEVSGSLRAGWGGRLRGSYTFLATEVLSVDGRSGVAPPPFSPGDRLVRRPRHSASIDAIASRARWSAFARVGWRGAVLDVDPTLGAFGGKLTAAGYAVADAGAALRLGRRLEVFARMRNLFDAAYEEVLGYPAPGRHVMAGLRVAAGR